MSSRMRCASRLRWPWLTMGLEPPDESIRISDQMRPVRMFTEATLAMAILSSSAPKKRGVTRKTCRGVISIRTGNNKFPAVHRLALKTYFSSCSADACTLLLSSPCNSAIARSSRQARRTPRPALVW